MSNIYLEAIRALPEEWLHEKTQITTTCMRKGAVIAANPELPAMIYEDGKWHKIEWNKDKITFTTGAETS